jgi:hypothetical protein
MKSTKIGPHENFPLYGIIENIKSLMSSWCIMI